MSIKDFVAYMKQLWKNDPDTSTPLSAERLGHIEDGIKGNSNAIEAIAAAVVSQIINDPNKIASMAALYSVNQALIQLNSDMNASVHGYITTGGDINTILDGIYLYNGWADMVGDKPFVNAYGIWIKRTPFNSIDSTARVDCVINSTSGIVYVRTGGSEGSWKSK